jgi:hypothetical protein
MPKEIAKITKKYMQNPKEITIGRKNEGSNSVKHVYYLVHAKDKYLALKTHSRLLSEYIRNYILPYPSRDTRNCRQADTRWLQCRLSAR